MRLPLLLIAALLALALGPAPLPPPPVAAGEVIAERAPAEPLAVIDKADGERPTGSAKAHAPPPIVVRRRPDPATEAPRVAALSATAPSAPAVRDLRAAIRRIRRAHVPRMNDDDPARI